MLCRLNEKVRWTEHVEIIEGNELDSTNMLLEKLKE
jgi:hypothetical protein